MTETSAETTRAGFAALIGAPNAGKSTLLNRILGQKISIVSRKVQTTRIQVRGVLMHGASQIVFVDTPGIFQPKRRLDRAMVHAAWSGAHDADTVVLLVDAQKGVTEEVQRILDGLKASGREGAILALNKVDLVKPDVLLPLAEKLSDTGLFDAVFMISAETGSGVGDLIAEVARRMPEGPYLYPEDHLTDLPERLIAAEITREKIFERLHDELPYKSTVETEKFEERPDGSARIEQTIYVARDGHKGIFLGKGGATIKDIGKRARIEISEVLDRPVHLFLFVKVRENWEDDPERYRDWGLDYKGGA
ncbi:GTPase Era [Futiania mangrovi]|uniref:GTPase Era n=1 Tax=Futiania mangrovi TaxID=2959716 RepID=A0A9J6PC42_9PROT|nr:GTPase Era [Futiania mangrovii]MCP1336105.1 GTPase Era [Futiania mangrovii]